MKNKIFSLIIAVLMLGVAWPLRGRFGHLPGAMIAGTAAGLIPLLAFRGRWLAATGLGLVFGALGFAIGGHLGYGSLFAAVEHKPLLESLPALLQLFLIGGIWGGIGGTLLGFAFSEKTFGRTDFLVLTIVSATWFFLIAFLDVEYLSLTVFYAGFAAFHIYNYRSKKSKLISLLGAGSYLGFGFAFVSAALILHAGRHGYLPGPRLWLLRDQWIGFVGALTLWGLFNAAEKRELFPSLMHDVAGLHRVGTVAVVAGVTGANMLNVIVYWKESGVMIMHQVFFLLIMPTFLLIFVLYLLKYPDNFSIRLEKNLARIAIFFFGFLSLTASAKETFIYGFSRWEKADTQYFIFSFLLTVILLIRLRPLRKI